MHKKWSREWVASKQPRKQRKYRYYAPLHVRQRLVSANLDKKLREQYKRRALPLRSGDEILIMRGEFKKQGGKVKTVDLKKVKLTVEGIKIKKVSGQEVDVYIDPSNVKITKLNLDDKKRLAKLSKAK
jgi:large subunit ribosomal protein L24